VHIWKRSNLYWTAFSSLPQWKEIYPILKTLLKFCIIAIKLFKYENLLIFFLEICFHNYFAVLPINPVIKGIGRKNCRGRWQWKNKDREIEPISFPLLCQWRVKVRTGHTKAHPKETMHQERRVKSEDLLYGETPIFGKMPNFSKNFCIFSGPHLSLISPATRAAKN